MKSALEDPGLDSSHFLQQEACMVALASAYWFVSRHLLYDSHQFCSVIVSKADFLQLLISASEKDHLKGNQ